MIGVLTRIFENFDFLRSSESTFFFSNPYKTPEMNELDIELSKKSKIIEIGSVEKKVTALQTWRNFEKIRKSQDFRTINIFF